MQIYVTSNSKDDNYLQSVENYLLEIANNHLSSKVDIICPIKNIVFEGPMLEKLKQVDVLFAPEKWEESLNSVMEVDYARTYHIKIIYSISDLVEYIINEIQGGLE